MTTLLWKSI